MTPDKLVPTQKCSTGCPILDTFLRGGVPCNSITEIAAESGSGKTQLCLQLSLCAQLPPSLGGLSSSSLYLHTEFPFPSRRLHQLSLSFLSMYPQLTSNRADYNPCDNVYVQSIANADHLLDVISKTEHFLVNSKLQLPMKLIVIDSIAALFRSEFENTPSDLKRRSVLFFKISGMFKALAKKFNLAVLVTNQVVDVMGDGEGVNGVRIGNLGSLFTSGRRVSPALGLAWANCVNSRLFLSRDEHEDSSSCRQKRIALDNEQELDVWGKGAFRTVIFLLMVSPSMVHGTCKNFFTCNGKNEIAKEIAVTTVWLIERKKEKP